MRLVQVDIGRFNNLMKFLCLVFFFLLIWVSVDQRPTNVLILFILVLFFYQTNDDNDDA